MSDHELNRCLGDLEEQVKYLTTRQTLLALCVAVEAVILLIIVV